MTSVVYFLCSGPSLALVLERENAIEEFKKLLGPKDLETAEADEPEWCVLSYCKLFHEDNDMMRMVYCKLLHAGSDITT